MKRVRSIGWALYHRKTNRLSTLLELRKIMNYVKHRMLHQMKSLSQYQGMIILRIINHFRVDHKQIVRNMRTFVYFHWR